MAVEDWSTDPNLNATVDGINIAEGCPAENLNNGLRAVMAAVRNMQVAIMQRFAAIGSILGVNARVDGRGAVLHNADPSLASGRVFRIPAGSAIPSGLQNGDSVEEYV